MVAEWLQTRSLPQFIVSKLLFFSINNPICTKNLRHIIMSVAHCKDEGTIPITERPNELTFDIDVGTASDIARTLRQCSSQIFSGWKHFPSIYDEEALAAMDKIAEKAAEMLQENSGETAIVLSGCGTSGRLAFFLAQKFSQLAAAQQLSACYEYLIAGGDVALFTSQEAPEDDWKKGQEDLIEVSRNKKRVLFIGITCGLSAPYVAGQLDYCMSHPDIFIPVLLGFNPVHQARQIAIEGWDKSFFDVANALEGKKITGGGGGGGGVLKWNLNLQFSHR